LSHWYETKTGEPRYTVIGANGKERDTTLSDAKKLKLLPSCTTIIGQLDQYWLTQWKIGQAIEIVILAHLSQDQALIRLINDGRDIYKYFASIMYAKPEAEVTPEERNSLKVPILGISYGKGFKKLSKETGQSEEWCQQFILNFYQEFPDVKAMHERWIREVNQSGQLQTFDGIFLQFKKYPKQYNEDYQCWFKEGYSPPEIKNYPVQHSAFVVLSVFLTTFWRQKAIYKRDKYLLINTVHDSIMLDCRPESVDEAIKDLNDVLTMLPDLMYNTYNIRFETKFKAEVTTADNWYDLA